MIRLNEMAYPSTFNMEEFETIRSHSGKIKYATERLKRLGSGSSRVVFQIDDEKVLKIAKNEKGIAQNEVETDWSMQKNGIVAKVFEHSRNPKGVMWLEMELAKKVNSSRFKQLCGYDIKVLNDFLLHEAKRMQPSKTYYFQSTLSDEQAAEMWESEFISDLMNFITNYDMMIPGDFVKLSSWGEVISEGTPSLVMIDFGFSSNVQYQYYKIN